MIIGMVALETCLILGQGFIQFTLLDEKAPDGYMWSRGDQRGNSLHPGQIIYGQSSGNQWESMPS